MITISHISKSFGELKVLDNVSARIEKGECVSIIGPSGVGKSVFLRTMAMLERPDSGEIWINDTEITRKGANLNQIRQKMGMVYQGFHLFSHLNVLDNVTLAPRKVKQQKRADAEKRAMELLAMVGLTDKAKNLPAELSGGQQQRTAIARCLAMDPEILLFDEPTSALDPAMTSEVLAIIRKLRHSGMTMIIVTHEMNFAREISDRIFYIDEGGIYEEGTPSEIFDHPRKTKTKTFIRNLKVFRYDICSKGFDSVGMNAKMELFLQKYRVDPRLIYHAQLVTEELLLSVFSSCYDTVNPELTLTLEYAEKDRELLLSLLFTAQPFNPLEQGTGREEDLGMLIVNKIAKKTDYRHDGFRNTITIYL